MSRGADPLALALPDGREAGRCRTLRGAGQPQQDVRIGALEGKRTDAADRLAARGPRQHRRLPGRGPRGIAPGHHGRDVLVDVAQVQDGQLHGVRQRSLGVRQPDHAGCWLRVPNPRLGRKQDQGRGAPRLHQAGAGSPNLDGVAKRRACTR